MSNLNVYIPTCDSHLFVVKGFAHFFNKYWGEDFQVKILGFTEPNFDLPSNFEFISMGKEQVGKAKGWSTISWTSLNLLMTNILYLALMIFTWQDHLIENFMKFF